MHETYSTYDAKSKLSEILRKVEAGASVWISRHGEPVAEIRPLRQPKTALDRRLDELVARGVVVPASESPDGLREIASRPGALARFLADRDE